ncbi:hypothetical protein G7Z17_g13151 [Cylindrodendrum hubeiense]|uniref:Uncharacterized protein n=1 Tax=Cylindrodendrum hubeiense TaxID=595255 RepID=A0A9P5H0I4_9HYPO|nr:hypothetical protein G7Z17_g13151 [Cylindrodendrum hubeiense]
MVHPMTSITGSMCDRARPKASGSSNPEGFKFIISTPSQRRSHDHQRLVRSHVTRGRGRRKGYRPLPSWMNKGVDEPPQPNQQQGPSNCLIPSPTRVGSELDWVRLPEAMKPYMLQNIIRFLTVIQDGLYPLKICLEVEPDVSDWIGSLFTDPVYLQSMLFSSEAYLDESLGRNRSESTQFHLLKTLRLLQKRISVPNDPLAISDQTIMAVVSLALAAQYFGDRDSVENHMQGLQKMVDLRGGFGTLETSTHELPSKICSEIMVSVLYRLLHMSFEQCPLNEALRVGMVAFTQAIFLQWQYFKMGEGRLKESFSNALLKLQESFIEVPPPVLFWLLTLLNTSFSTDAEGRHAGWFSEVIELVHLSSWEEARKVLKSLVWIDSLNDSKGKVAFGNAKLTPA